MNAERPLESLLTAVAGKPHLMVRLAQQLIAKGKGGQARELCMQALAQAPDDREVRSLAAAVLSYDVPNWHFYMVHDHARNLAYDAALRRAVKPGCRVLEIGAGSGLLAMMAARAGAAEVTTCEVNPAIAEVAGEIIARNGFADRVRLVAKHSSDLELGVDLVEPADILLSEIVSNNLIGEGVLPAVEQVARRLLKPDACIIPAGGSVRVALAEDLEADRRQMHGIAGFDLSPFNRLAPPCYPINVGSRRLVLHSEPANLFCFDFQSRGPFPEARATTTLSASGGHVNGIAQWIRLDMDGVGRYEDIPSVGATAAWAVLFYPLQQAIEMKPGDELTVCGAHDRLTLHVWAIPA